MGKIRSLGVSNFGIHHLEELAAHIAAIDQREGKGAGGVISVNQVEVHPWLPRTELRKWCHTHGIIVQAYSPLARGQRMNEQVLREVAQRARKTPAQILLRWGLQQGLVPTVKSVDDSIGGRIQSNFDVFGWKLGAKELAVMNGDEAEERYSPSGWDPTVEPLSR